MAESRGDDNRGCNAFFAGRSDDSGHGLRGRSDHEQIGGMAQLLESFDGLDAFDFGVVRIDKADRSFEPGLAKTSQDRATRRRFAWARTHNRD